MPRFEQALSHLRVLELGGPLAQYCGKLLADLGADVIKIEPPRGDPVRRLGPWASDRQGSGDAAELGPGFGSHRTQGQGPDPVRPEPFATLRTGSVEGRSGGSTSSPRTDDGNPARSLPFLYFNSNKRSVVLDLATDEGRGRLLALVETADAVIEGFQPGYLQRLGLGFDALRRVNRALVVTSVTGFGQTGLYRDFKSTDLVAFAMGGVLSMSGDPAAAPVVAPCEQGHQLAGAHAAYATLAALLSREGQGGHLDISVQDALASVYFTIVRYGISAEIVQRTGSSVPSRTCAIFPTEDGHASIYVNRATHFRAFLDWAGHPEELQDPQWVDRDYRTEHYEPVHRQMGRLAAARTTEQVVREGQGHHITVGPVNSVAGFAEHEHTRHRGFFVAAEVLGAGQVPFPGPAYRFGASPWRLRRPAPTLGEHTGEGWRVEGGGWRGRGEGREGGTPALPGVRPAQSPSPSTLDPPPLKGVRILDLSRVWAGPFGTRFLGDLGAEVIRVETSLYPDGRPAGPAVGDARRHEQAGIFQEVNRSKLGVTLNLNDPRARDLLRRLVRLADVLTENFSPRIMKRWDLDYPHLRQVRPDLIMLSQPGFGASGPLRDFVAYGANITSFSGMASLWAHAGAPGEVWCQLSYPDFVAAAHAAVALTAALHYRQRTGEGQHIELAMVDVAAATLGVAYLDYAVNGRAWQPRGNRSPHWAQNLYRCRGEDRWCAIALTADEEWERFCAVLGQPTWAKDQRFATNAGRLEHQDELDRQIGDWTAGYTPHQVMWLLQRADVPAAAVQTGEDLFYDPHLRSREFITQVEHGEVGLVTHAGVVVREEGRPREVGRRAPLLGEHNEYVFGDLLGLSTRTIQELVEAEVLA